MGTHVHDCCRGTLPPGYLINHLQTSFSLSVRQINRDYIYTGNKRIANLVPLLSISLPFAFAVYIVNDDARCRRRRVARASADGGHRVI